MHLNSRHRGSVWGAPRSRLGLIVLTVALTLSALVGAVQPGLRTSPLAALLPVAVALLALLPRPAPVVQDSWLLERTTRGAMIAASVVEVTIAVTGAVVAVAVESPRPLVAAAGAVLVLGFLVVADVASARER